METPDESGVSSALRMNVIAHADIVLSDLHFHCALVGNRAQRCDGLDPLGRQDNPALLRSSATSRVPQACGRILLDQTLGVRAYTKCNCVPVQSNESVPSQLDTPPTIATAENDFGHLQEGRREFLKQQNHSAGYPAVQAAHPPIASRAIPIQPFAKRSPLASCLPGKSTAA